MPHKSKIMCHQNIDLRPGSNESFPVKRDPFPVCLNRSRGSNSTLGSNSFMPPILKNLLAP